MSASGPADLGGRRAGACPTCGTPPSAPANFCETCGAELPTAAEPTLRVRRPCPACGGTVGDDGVCQACGTRPTSRREHYAERPASWVAAVCDRGIRHPRNEDATAVAAEAAPGSRAVLVVCDGVSTSTDSDAASLAAAQAARDWLVSHGRVGAGTGGAAGRIDAITAALVAAVEAANAAVVDTTSPGTPNPASCTFAGAVLEGDLVVWGTVGDSRAYWLPDIGSAEPARQLSQDDSVAQLRIASGVPRAEAEEGPQAHAIMKWLGRNSPDITPATGAHRLTGPGWVLVCSDGLWNYASAPVELQARVAQLCDGTAEPLRLAEDLVRWACEQGGKDNIAVALARHG